MVITLEVFVQFFEGPLCVRPIQSNAESDFIHSSKHLYWVLYNMPGSVLETRYRNNDEWGCCLQILTSAEYGANKAE